MNAFRLDGQVAVVTGAGKGIGRGIAFCLAEAGADVVVSARTSSDIDEVADAVRRTGRRSAAVAADVTDGEQLDALVDAAGELGGLNIWVSNAGGLPDATPRYLTRTPEDRWDAQVDLNLKAVWMGAVRAAAAMESGSIVNISSRAAMGPQLKNGPYGASKAAVNSLTQTLAVELAPRIRVNAVAPGPIPTENFLQSTNFPDDQPLEKIIGLPLGRLGTPEDIGNAVVFMASPAASWITGQCLYVSGGP
ncbi:MAG: glucose 1-dehydrogenase [Gammaproteobacteria bacterium]|nr:glucose 1-dehydrogenase [Gammaproteobacteria bacterium]MDE0367265.1 glucose 1-dehydrogenase [Gammaproteobacteria bacterium]